MYFSGELMYDIVNPVVLAISVPPLAD